jgi:hypothetical protein
MTIKYLRPVVLIWISVAMSLSAYGQLDDAPRPQPGNLVGTVMDATGGIIPGASITADGPEPRDRATAIANGDAFFTLAGLNAGVSYRVTVAAPGFAVWTSQVIILNPGQTSIIRRRIVDRASFSLELF